MIPGEIGHNFFREVRTVEHVLIVPHDSSNVNDPRDRREQVTTLATSTREVPQSKLQRTLVEVLNDGRS